MLKLANFIKNQMKIKPKVVLINFSALLALQKNYFFYFSPNKTPLNHINHNNSFLRS